MSSIRVVEYLDEAERSPYEAWFESLDGAAAAKVAAALYRLQSGNFSNVEGVGGGVYERKIDFGPGYRIYFGKDGKDLVILLGGSNEKRQSAAVERARGNWIAYKRRKP